MRWLAAPAAALACIITLPRSTEAAPEVAFPVNSQVPPVAYASQPYNYSFSSTTFQTTTPPISYAITGGPTWLFLNTTLRLLSGTPTANDVGATTFQLVAKDEQGETSSSVTLVVLAFPNVQKSGSALPYLEAAGPVSAPATLLLLPLTPFALKFSTDIFSGQSLQTSYYATSGDHSPLPPWIQFNSQDLSFSGSSPPLVSQTATQQTYGFHLIATDVVGFAEASIGFQIALSYHILVFSAASQTVSVTRGQLFQSKSFRNELTLDGRLTVDEELVSVTADVPYWLKFDSRQILLRGVPPAGFKTMTVTVSITDAYSDTASMSIVLADKPVEPSRTNNTIDLTAFTGTYFTYTLDASIVTSTQTQIQGDLADASDWLEFSIKNLTLHGYVPTESMLRTLNLSLTIKEGDATTLLHIAIHIERALVGSQSWTSRPPVTSATRSSSASPISGGRGRFQTGTNLSTGKIVAIVVSVVLLVFAVFGLVCLCSQRQLRKARLGKESDISEVNGAEVSRVSEPTPVIHNPPTERASRAPTARGWTPTQTPHIELPWAPDSLQKSKERLSRRLWLDKDAIFSSSWGNLVTSSNIQPDTGQAVSSNVAHWEGSDRVSTLPAPPLPIQSAKRTSLSSNRPKPTKIRRDTVSRAQSKPSVHGATIPHRFSGAGHGTLMSPADSSVHRLSWQTTFASTPDGDTRRNTVNLDSFPPPPSNKKVKEAPESFPLPSKPTMRLVENDSSHSNSPEDQRQKWHTEQAREKLEGGARFSNARSARSPSMTRVLLTTALSPSRTISTTIPEHRPIESRISKHSWSRRSSIGPASLRDAQYHSRVGRDPSLASSGQFDSAHSSDSQWEDENLNEDGQKHWQIYKESGTSSPRLPFEPFSNSQDQMGSINQVGISWKARLIDQRRHVSIEESDLKRSEKSHRGSFRFI